MSETQYAFGEYILQPCRNSGRNSGTPLCGACHPKQVQWCKDNQNIIKAREIKRQGRTAAQQHTKDNEDIINKKYAAIIAAAEEE